MMGGGRPAGGRHGNIRDTPSWTTIGFIFSFDHKGDPGLFKGHTHVNAWHSPCFDMKHEAANGANVVTGVMRRNERGDVD